MKKSELKQLIREVVREVYSQQDEGLVDKIGDFLTDPTGRKRKAADAESREEEKSKNEKFKQFKDTIQHNLKSIPKYVEAFTAKAREVYKDAEEARERGHGRSGPQYHQGNGYYSRDAGQDYEYWEKRTKEQDAAQKDSYDNWRRNLKSIEQKYEDIKKFIDYIQGQFRTGIKELEQYDSYDSAKNMFANSEEYTNDRIDRIEEFRSEYSIRPIGYENEFKKLEKF